MGKYKLPVENAHTAIMVGVRLSAVDSDRFRKLMVESGCTSTALARSMLVHCIEEAEVSAAQKRNAGGSEGDEGA